MPRNMAGVGLRARPYRLHTGTPVFASIEWPTLAPASVAPRKPCSGAKMAASVTPGAAFSRSARWAPLARLVRLAMRPTRLPASGANRLASRTWAPTTTGRGDTFALAGMLHDDPREAVASDSK